VRQRDEVRGVIGAVFCAQDDVMRGQEKVEPRSWHEPSRLTTNAESARHAGYW